MKGKLIDGRLVIAGNTIKDGNTTITNPTQEILTRLGYKEIVYADKPEYDKENEKLIEIYNEVNISEKIQDGVTRIVVNYEKVSLSSSEHNAVIQAEIVAEENKITSRNIRTAIKGDTFALAKIDEVEENIQTLREKLIEIPEQEEE